MFVKICGTTSFGDAVLAIEGGADALGFIFAPSKRQVDVETAATVIAAISARIQTVAVFRDAGIDEVCRVVEATGVGAVQLHGGEDAAFIAALRRRFNGQIIKALSADDPMVRRADEYGADFILLDAPAPGSGEAFDWSLVRRLPNDTRFMLAGGLHPDNVAEAIRATHPWGVDVVSGVESSPGKKDPVKLHRFIEAAKSGSN